jgi:diguanylate cyclase (GGDEF)-like protein
MSPSEDQRRAGVSARLGVLIAGLIALAAILLLGPLKSFGLPAGAPIELPWWSLVLAFIGAELLAVHLETRSEAHDFTFTEVVYVVGLLLSTPEAMVIGRIGAGVVVLALLRRQSLLKLATNLSMFAAEAALVAALFHALVGQAAPTGPRGWVAAMAATLGAYLFSLVVITAAITIYSGWPGIQLLRQLVLFGGLVAVANTAIGLGLVTALWDGSAAGFVLLPVGAILFVLYRTYTQLTERHKNLETLHDFTRDIGGSLELLELEREVLGGAREILRAEHGALLLPPVRDDQPASRLIARGPDMTRLSTQASELLSDLAVLLPEGQARLIQPGDPVPGWLAEIGVKDGMVVPVTTDGLPTGAMLVVNRLTEVSTFVEDDLRVFATLASHGGVALENGRLVATLQHEAADKAYQAMHDPVTELPNRQALTEELEREIALARPAGSTIALVCVDLDTFREVSDTLGLATADQLLCEVRDRLEVLLPPGSLLARYTGDSFAALLPGADGESAMEVAERLHAAFDEPLTNESISLVLGASLGVALFPDHANAADVLLKRADAATYAARLAGSGIEVYTADSDPYAPRRLALAGDLREGLDAGQVEVFVQPKVSIGDGVVRGAEALVRWTHPRLGPMRPDQFIPAAEHTGVIRPLTLYVMRGALAQCRAWRDAGHDLSIAVNLSVRNLFDGHFVDDLRELLRELGLGPEVLTLELTESIVMGESRRSMEVLEGIRELGVGLAVDDFGTGYSSLTHLRRLPVTELKIDRSFVSTMTVNDHDAVIVRSLVELGRNLGLDTVAEGVESQEALDLLEDYECDMAQGYLISRPLPADQFVTWLNRQPADRLPKLEGIVPFAPRRRAVE